MKIYEKAKELATLISESEQLQAMRDSEKAMMGDEEARKLVEEYQELQMEAMKSGLQFDELPEDKQKKIETIEEKMAQNDKIVTYMDAQEALEQILRSINLIISGALNENQGACPSSGCSSCSGC